MILFCDEKKRDNIIRKLKGKSTQLYKDNQKIKEPFHLWARKYNWTYILDDNALSNAYEYVKYNRIKHNLPENKKLEEITENMVTGYEKLLMNN
jgi:REP element-mobilizing transposase RayT